MRVTKYEEFQIFVETLSDKTITLDVNASDTVKTVMEKVDELEDPPESFGLYFKCDVLDPAKTLMDYNIQKDFTLTMLDSQGVEVALVLTNMHVMTPDELTKNIEAPSKKQKQKHSNNKHNNSGQALKEEIEGCKTNDSELEEDIETIEDPKTPKPQNPKTPVT